MNEDTRSKNAGRGDGTPQGNPSARAEGPGKKPVGVPPPPPGVRKAVPPPLPQKRPAADAKWAEKRAAPRREVVTEVTLESETNFYAGFTVDVSVGGLFVVTWNTFPIGTTVQLTFTLPGVERPITVDGQVRWVREHNPLDKDLWPGMGIQFQGLADSDRELIEAFVARREPLFYD